MFLQRQFNFIEPTIQIRSEESQILHSALGTKLFLPQTEILDSTITQCTSVVIVSYVQRDFWKL